MQGRRHEFNKSDNRTNSYVSITSLSSYDAVRKGRVHSCGACVKITFVDSRLVIVLNCPAVWYVVHVYVHQNY